MPFDSVQLADWQVILLKAADEIETHGLAKNERCRLDGAMCVHGAIAFVATGDPVPEDDGAIANEAGHRLARYLYSLGDRNVILSNGDCAPWNNEESQTASNVASVMRSCAMKG